VDEVEGTRGQIDRARVALDSLHIGEVVLDDGFPKPFEHARLAFESDHLASWSDTLRQEIHNAERTAAYVDCAPTRLDADAIEQPTCFGLEDLAVLQQAFPLAEARSEQVLPRLNHRAPAVPNRVRTTPGDRASTAPATEFWIRPS
jgi:hypothetical protein